MLPFQIGDFFGFLAQSQKAYSRQLEPVCKKWDLTRSEVDVLLFLYNNPAYDRAADIVTYRGMTKSHISMSVANLVDRGLLERQYAPEDRRTAHLRIVGEGQSIAAEAREAQQQFFGFLYEGITEEERAQMNTYMERIHHNIENLSKTV